VLLGAEMPSILVEAGFISNPEECRRLIDPEYQRLLAQGILDGIKATSTRCTHHRRAVRGGAELMTRRKLPQTGQSRRRSK
jgi:hypothetical protein